MVINKMTWPKFFDSKWFERLFTVALAVLTLLLTQSIITKREYNNSLRKEFDARPTKVEVNQQVSTLQDYVDKQDENLYNSLNQHIQESNRTQENMANWMRSIDSKLNTLLSREK